MTYATVLIRLTSSSYRQRYSHALIPGMGEAASHTVSLQQLLPTLTHCAAPIDEMSKLQ